MHTYFVNVFNLQPYITIFIFKTFTDIGWMKGWIFPCEISGDTINSQTPKLDEAWVKLLNFSTSSISIKIFCTMITVPISAKTRAREGVKILLWELGWHNKLSNSETGVKLWTEALRHHHHFMSKPHPRPIVRNFVSQKLDKGVKIISSSWLLFIVNIDTIIQMTSIIIISCHHHHHLGHRRHHHHHPEAFSIWKERSGSTIKR